MMIANADINLLRKELKVFGYSLRTKTFDQYRSHAYIYKGKEQIIGFSNVFPREFIEKHAVAFELYNKYKR